VSTTGERETGHGGRGTLVVQTAHLGDLVLTLPLIQQLARQFGPVDVVVTPAAAALLNGEPSVHRVVPYDKRGADRGVAGLLRLARRLRSGRYLRAFLPHRSLRSALLVRLAGIPQRTGFAGSLASLTYTRRVQRALEAHETLRLARLAGSPDPPGAPWFRLAPEDVRAADSWLAARAIGQEFVVLAPGARWATKRWPWFAELAARLDISLVVVGGAEDRGRGEAVVRAASGRAHSAAGEMTLTQVAALISRAALVVSNDSVAMHLAVALARPIIAIVGPTGPAPGFQPLSSADTVVAHTGLACRPCSPHGHDRCPLGHHRCMIELEVEPVQALVWSRLERERQRNSG
jgi:lipopolysaccharide heptosyltransferase II